MSDTTKSFPAVKSLSFFANFVGIVIGIYTFTAFVWLVIDLVRGERLTIGSIYVGGFPIGVGTPLYWIFNLGVLGLISILSAVLVWAGFRARREISA